VTVGDAAAATEDADDADATREEDGDARAADPPRPPSPDFVPYPDFAPSPPPPPPTPPTPPPFVPPEATLLDTPLECAKALGALIDAAAPVAVDFEGISLSRTGKLWRVLITPVPVRPRRRGERRSLRTYFSSRRISPPTPRWFQSRHTHLDAFQLRF
jgi:hypothetical protein